MAELTSAQQAAMLIMSLEEEQAAELLKHMSDGCAAKLREAARQLDPAAIGDQERRQALLGFFVQKRKGAFPLGNPDERFRRVLARAKGEEMVRRVYAPEAEEPETPGPDEMAPLEFISQYPEEHLARVLAEETPRCAAVLLNSLEGRKAGRILNMLEDEQREQVVNRMIAAENITPEVTRHVVAGFREKLAELGSGPEAESEEKRTRELAQMIGTLEQETQEAVLSRMAEADPELAQEVERLIFGFDDLMKVADRSMQELLRNVEVNCVTLALKGAPADMQEHFYTNLSQRQRERVEEEREMAGRVPLSEVENAREEIMQLARKMYRDQQLIVEIGDEQYVE